METTKLLSNKNIFLVTFLLLIVCTSSYSQTKDSLAMHFLEKILSIKDTTRSLSYSVKATFTDSTGMSIQTDFTIQQAFNNSSTNNLFYILATDGDVKGMTVIFDGQQTIVFKSDTNIMLKKIDRIPPIYLIPFISYALELPVSRYNNWLTYDTTGIKNGYVFVKSFSTDSLITTLETETMGKDSVSIIRKLKVESKTNKIINYRNDYVSKNNKRSCEIQIVDLKINTFIAPDLFKKDESGFIISDLDDK